MRSAEEDLGRIDRDQDRLKASQVNEDDGGNGDEEESDYDPWASVKKFI